MAQAQTITPEHKTKLVFTYEGKVILFTTLCCLGIMVYLRHELGIFLVSFILASQIAIRFVLPNPKISFSLKSYSPDYYQAGGANTHHLELIPKFTGSPLPYLLVYASHKHSKGQMIRSSSKLFQSFRSNEIYDIDLIIEPQCQGMIEFNGLIVKSFATLGLYEWKHIIPLKLTRPIHPRQMPLRALDYLKLFWGESDLNETQINTLQQGEYIGWPRAYQPGDPLAAINWKRLAQNMYEPIVHNAITSESDTIHLVLDTSLKVRKRGAQKKLEHLCEFTRSLAHLLEKEGAEMTVIICSDQPNYFQLQSKFEWIDFLNHLAPLKVIKESCAFQEIEKLSQGTPTKIIHLSLEANLDHNNLIEKVIQLDYSDVLNYSLEKGLDSDQEGSDDDI